MFYQWEHIGTPDEITVERNRNFSFPPHIHPCFEIIILKNGKMNVTVDGTVFLLKQGDGILIFPHQVHALESAESEHILCILPPEFVKSFWSETREKIPEDNRFVPNATLTALFESLDEKSPLLLKKGTLYLLCNAFHQTARYRKRGQESQSLLHKIFAFVDANFDNACSLGELAEELGYNYSYLSRYFKSAVGMTFNTYVTHYRLNQACYLLKNSPAPVVQCAFDSGFISLRNFNRCFKQRFGIPPKEYRKKAE